MNTYTIINGELYHHGVKGMKWGVRRYQNEDGTLTPAGKARQSYKDAKSAYIKTVRMNPTGLGIGVKGIEKYDRARNKRNDAYVDMVTAKANYKTAKSTTSQKAQKAEFKTYVNAMSKTGIPGSAADSNAGGRSKAIYNKLTVEKGKAYADRVAKKVQNRAIGTIVGSAAVSAGALVAASILGSQVR